MTEIVNRVTESGLLTIDLENYSVKEELYGIDLSDQLWQGLALKEKDFRDWIKSNDWATYKGKKVYIYCSVDAIIPTWAYMLVSSALEPYTKQVYFTNPENLSTLVAERALAAINEEDYRDKRVVIKGCGKRAISNHAYVLLTNKLVRTAKTVMFGEPCSTVPVYKQRK